MGTPAITLSLSDPAGSTMFEILKEKGFKETEEANVYLNDKIYLFVVDPLIVPEERYKVPAAPDPYPAGYDLLAGKYEIDYIVVASRHWAESGKPSLTVHSTGNFGKAMYGGRPRELQFTAPNPMRDIYLKILVEPPTKFSVSLEATHHSPTMFNVPMFFVEVGSREAQWRDREVCNYLVESILAGIKEEGKAPVAIGFGGGHYCPYFSPAMTDYAFGHIAAKYSLPLLSEELVKQMIEKSGDVEFAILDGGLKGHERKKVEVFLNKLYMEII